ncbi:MAG: PD-(D/E)XK nuclease family protein [Candidatus Staskawiczbacteria bacterium]|nr:PD-(D/E)XK nuclease family protein [Candidatus Staskawiczbacteria bacterium]
MAGEKPDKYNAVWVSHSSINDFLKCPRAYFLHNMYKNERGRKINIVNVHLSLGIAVHETLEGLLNYKKDERFKKPLLQTFEENWAKVSGKVGGFKNAEEEIEAKARAKAMIERVNENPGPLEKLAVKLKEHANNMPPNFYLSEKDNIILSGKIDWLEYVPEDDSVRVIDFKTGKNDEDKDSLQLPIYILLLNALQKRKVSGVAYWYIDRNTEPTEMALPDIKEAQQRVLEAALKVKKAREGGVFVCPRGAGGCFACKPFEKILKGEAELVRTDETRKTELYMV